MELLIGKSWTQAPIGTYYLYGGPNAFNDSEWNLIVFSEVPNPGDEAKWDTLDNPPDQSNDGNTNTGLTIKPLGDGKPDKQTLRYPMMQLIKPLIMFSFNLENICHRSVEKQINLDN